MPREQHGPCQVSSGVIQEAFSFSPPARAPSVVGIGDGCRRMIVPLLRSGFRICRWIKKRPAEFATYTDGHTLDRDEMLHRTSGRLTNAPSFLFLPARCQVSQ
jgi:hypothetical protein